jgi:hypothetical protein
MKIYISINGVLRDLIKKFDNHYNIEFIDETVVDETQFKYEKSNEIYNDDLLKYYTFQSKEEYENFLYIEHPLEIFGHAPLSYSKSIYDLNKLIYDNPDHEFTVVGVDEMGKAKPATLFFLSKNWFLGDNVKFITKKQIKKEWKKCDVWVTDDISIIKSTPKKKMSIKFNTNYNTNFTHDKEITNINEVENLCLKF